MRRFKEPMNISEMETTFLQLNSGTLFKINFPDKITTLPEYKTTKKYINLMRNLAYGMTCNGPDIGLKALMPRPYPHETKQHHGSGKRRHKKSPIDSLDPIVITRLQAKLTQTAAFLSQIAINIVEVSDETDIVGFLYQAKHHEEFEDTIKIVIEEYFNIILKQLNLVHNSRALTSLEIYHLRLWEENPLKTDRKHYNTDEDPYWEEALLHQFMHAVYGLYKPFEDVIHPVFPFKQYISVAVSPISDWLKHNERDYFIYTVIEDLILKKAAIHFKLVNFKNEKWEDVARKLIDNRQARINHPETRKFCDCCYREFPSLRRCTRCLAHKVLYPHMYCGKVCQSQQWHNGHKEFHKALLWCADFCKTTFEPQDKTKPPSSPPCHACQITTTNGVYADQKVDPQRGDCQEYNVEEITASLKRSITREEVQYFDQFGIAYEIDVDNLDAISESSSLTAWSSLEYDVNDPLYDNMDPAFEVRLPNENCECENCQTIMEKYEMGDATISEKYEDTEMRDETVNDICEDNAAQMNEKSVEDYFANISAALCHLIDEELANEMKRSDTQNQKKHPKLHHYTPQSRNDEKCTDQCSPIMGKTDQNGSMENLTEKSSNKETIQSSETEEKTDRNNSMGDYTNESTETKGKTNQSMNDTMEQSSDTARRRFRNAEKKTSENSTVEKHTEQLSDTARKTNHDGDVKTDFIIDKEVESDGQSRYDRGNINVNCTYEKHTQQYDDNELKTSFIIGTEEKSDLSSNNDRKTDQRKNRERNANENNNMHKFPEQSSNKDEKTKQQNPDIEEAARDLTIATYEEIAQPREIEQKNDQIKNKTDGNIDTEDHTDQNIKAEEKTDLTIDTAEMIVQSSHKKSNNDYFSMSDENYTNELKNKLVDQKRSDTDATFTHTLPWPFMDM